MMRHAVVLCMVLLLLSNSLMGVSQKQNKRIGIQLWSVREDMKKDPEGTIRQLGEMGYVFVEAAGYDIG
ncbi:MAG: hypothetical protein N4A71_17530 [Carboxylicivirga sp.]|jgi:hypothetical protein|nr:hypothetical protein [Carboxylicivirga sp.]